MPFTLIRPDTLYAWKGPSLLIATTRGDCGGDHGLTGYYFREARFLRTLRLEINGAPPWLCDASAAAPDHLAFTYVHPEITEHGGGGTGQSGDEEHVGADGIPERALDIRVDYRLRVDGLQIELAIGNRALRPLRFEVTWQLGADYADIQEAQAGKREQNATVAAGSRDGVLEFAYEHPRLPYRTGIRHDGWAASGSALTATLTLEPQQTARRTLQIVPADGVEEIPASEAVARERTWQQWRGGLTRTEVPGNREFERAVAMNVRDVASFPLMTGPEDEWLAMQAGMPLYPAFFGRDAVTVGWQAALLDRGQSLDSALTKLGRLQSDRFDDWHDEQPGRIPYQMRTGPLARLDINPYAAYYADFASPLMYVISLANLYGWTGDHACVARHWDTARRIMEWAQQHGDADRDGYLEYLTRSSKGTKNQGWKDSGDAVIYDDGRPVPPPIATCDLQGYWYLAQELMALLSIVMEAPGDAAGFRQSAADLKQRFNRDWWVEDEQFFALALDPDKRRVGAVTSNVGHCLACGIIDRDHLAPVVGRLFAPDMFSGWGVRTLSSRHAFYNPISYHRGTVWAVEQATIVFGLRRFGFDARAIELSRALFDLACLYPDYRIPECVGGYARGDAPGPGAYPRANTPQLWNASAFPLTIQSLLGLVPLAPIETLLVDPVLPQWMPDLVLRGLRVGEATVTLRFHRDERGASHWEVLHKQGTLHIVRQPPPESVTAGAWQRTTALLETIGMRER
jgi:glycogen debranching enzyme